jgi:hypothetical protein
MPPGPHKRARSRPALAHVDSHGGADSGVRGSASSACTHPSLAAAGSKPGYGETGGGYTRGPIKVTPGNTHRQHKSVADREPAHQTSLNLLLIGPDQPERQIGDVSAQSYGMHEDTCPCLQPSCCCPGLKHVWSGGVTTRHLVRVTGSHRLH